MVMDKLLSVFTIWMISSLATSEIQRNFHIEEDIPDKCYLKETLSSLLRPLWSVFDVGEINTVSVGRYNTWIFSLLASCAVGLSGIVPLFIVSAECSTNLKRDRGAKTLRLLLSFSVGGLLGDVFLHLLPEAWNHLEKAGADCHTAYLTLGLWILIGIFTFIIIEMMFTMSQEQEEIFDKKNILKSNKEFSILSASSNGNAHHFKESNGVISNGCLNTQPRTIEFMNKPLITTKSETIQVAGYLNLMANSMDNFTHGLAVSASFVVGTKMGILTTLAILMHEIPHEVGDFVILLRSGFNRWDAAKAQISTAGVGILGAIVALSVDSMDTLGECTTWILPFTSGGFLNIALVNVLPDIMKDDDPWESLKQIGCLCSGIAVMALVTLITE